MCLPKAPDTSAQREEAERQQAAEQERIAADKRKRLAARKGQGGRATTTSLVNFAAAPAGAGGRSFFSGIGG